MAPRTGELQEQGSGVSECGAVATCQMAPEAADLLCAKQTKSWASVDSAFCGKRPLSHAGDDGEKNGRDELGRGPVWGTGQGEFPCGTWGSPSWRWPWDHVAQTWRQEHAVVPRGPQEEAGRLPWWP